MYGFLTYSSIKYAMPHSLGILHELRQWVLVWVKLCCYITLFPRALAAWRQQSLDRIQNVACKSFSNFISNSNFVRSMPQSGSILILTSSVVGVLLSCQWHYSVDQTSYWSAHESRKCGYQHTEHFEGKMHSYLMFNLTICSNNFNGGN